MSPDLLTGIANLIVHHTVISKCKTLFVGKQEKVFSSENNLFGPWRAILLAVVAKIFYSVQLYNWFTHIDRKSHRWKWHTCHIDDDAFFVTEQLITPKVQPIETADNSRSSMEEVGLKFEQRFQIESGGQSYWCDFLSFLCRFQAKPLLWGSDCQICAFLGISCSFCRKKANQIVQELKKRLRSRQFVGKTEPHAKRWADRVHSNLHLSGYMLQNRVHTLTCHFIRRTSWLPGT